MIRIFAASLAALIQFYLGVEWIRSADFIVNPKSEFRIPIDDEGKGILPPRRPAV